ncbi:MAG: MFS transporter [Arcobacteraceae bacterium]|jgi:MFS family permease|nr:MFS transporter [Arcobacteraceae bacterium]
MFKQVLPLSLIISMRFFGLFIVLPVISVYTLSLPGATPQIVGIVVGGYAITQMIFQVPFGAMSDILGRKGTIITGLLIFAIGSILCAVGNDLLTLLLGRFLQGAGAIGAVITAMISDLVKEEQRPKAMAIMGGMIGISFALAMGVGPVIAGFAGVQSLFWITAVLPLISIVVLLKLVPDAPKVTHTYHNHSKYGFLLKNEIIKMNITNFLQKGLMTFAFMIIPIILTKSFGWALTDLWKVYVPALILGVLSMGPAAIIAEKKGKFKEVLLLGIFFFGLSYYLIGNGSTELAFIIGVLVFFIGFNMHEPIMQSLTVKYAKVHEKGRVLGVFNSFGYAGTFVGGFVGGAYLLEINGSFASSLYDISMFIVAISIVWFILILALPNPTKMSNTYLNIENLDEQKYTVLDTVTGVDEWYINNTEKLLIVKYNNTLIDEEAIKNTIK